MMQNKHLSVLGQLEGARQGRQQRNANKWQSITQPLGQATGAFLMSQALGQPQEPAGPEGPQGPQHGMWGDGSSQVAMPMGYGFGGVAGGTTADLFRNWGR